MEDSWLWWRDGVIYQIYPRSFQDSNHDGVGDIQGIISRLEYLQALGVDAIWISPIYPSPNVDFGYDVCDYFSIHPDYGTTEDFDELVQAAHQRGIRIVMDLVLNHTSDQHPWFQEARKSMDAPCRDFYLWRDGHPGGEPPNNWRSYFGGSAWELDPASGQYYFHMFYKEQADLNWRSPEVHRAMLDVFRCWAERGVDGFRLDVFNLYFKDDQFRDNPGRFGLRAFDRQSHLYDFNRPEMDQIVAEIRQVLDGYPDRYSVGEPFLGNIEQMVQYAGNGKLHQVFDFGFLNSRWNARQFLQAIQRQEDVSVEGAWPSYVLSNHDVRRAASRYALGENDARLKVLAGLHLTQRGTPFLYYGEEIGQRDIQVPRGRIQDRVGRRYWPFYMGRDGCRAPMQWNAGASAGFSDVSPWQPVHQDYSKRNVESQQGEPNSLFHVYRSLIALRREYPALRQGMFIPLTYEPWMVFGYLRKTADQTILVALNFSRRKVPLVLGGMLAMLSWNLLYSTHRQTLEPLDSRLLPLAPYEVCILIQK